MTPDLPPGWVEACLGEIADCQLGKMLDKAKRTAGEHLPYLRNINVRWGAFNLSDLLQMPFTEEELYRFGIRDGDVLVCEGGEPGRAAVWKDGDTAIKFQKALHRIRMTGGISPDWLVHWLRLESSNGTLEDHFTGTTIKHFTGQALAQYRIPLPPLAEQRRIVAKIEALLERGRRARDALDSIPALLDRYRQSILAAAFRGDLTAEWREKHAGLPNAPASDGPFELPQTWQWQAFREVATVAADLVSPADHADAPHIAPNHMESGTGRLLPYGTVGEDGVKSPKHRFRPGQIIYSKIRPYLAKAVFVDFAGLCSADTYPVDTTLDPAYLQKWLISPDFTLMASGQQGRTVLPKINKDALYRLRVPVPPVEEQAQIAASLDRAFRSLEALRGIHEQSSTRLTTLTQSILAKAFRGELVEQDPSDDPASVLLERIRTERAAAPVKAKRGRKAQ